MSEPDRMLTVKTVALHVVCHACGATARILNDRYDRHVMAGGAFFTSHYQPELTAADVLINGQLQTVPVTVT